MSKKFSYSNTDCLVICDASILSEYNVAGLGWEIIDYNTKIKLAEGRGVTNTHISTVEAELLAIATALKEVKKMNYKNILIKTDYDGIIDNFSDNTKLHTILENFNSWCLETVERNNIQRAHDLCSSIDIHVNHSPTIKPINI